jgi:HK97 family phage major capsid protein
MTDARDTLDATKMLSGSGTAEPASVLTGLTTTQRVQTATTATFAVADPWSLKAALPARFVGNATVVANPAILDSVYRFTGGNATEPPIMPTRDGACFGKPARELSTMVTTTTTGSKIMLFGDFSNFLIVSRIGMQIELVPHLLGANRRPTGERGLFAYWRTGSGVVNANAFRYLEVKWSSQ